MKQRIHIRPLSILAALAAATAFAQDPVYQVNDARFGDGTITVEERRDPLDSRIQADVITRLRAMENIEGLIGVETRNAIVTLTGKVTTSGQANRAWREARNVSGVRAVDNDIRAKVGATY